MSLEMKKSRYIPEVGQRVKIIGINDYDGDYTVEGVVVNVVGPIGDIGEGVPKIHDFTINCGDKGEQIFNLNYFDSEYTLEVVESNRKF